MEKVNHRGCEWNKLILPIIKLRTFKAVSWFLGAWFVSHECLDLVMLGLDVFWASIAPTQAPTWGGGKGSAPLLNWHPGQCSLHPGTPQHCASSHVWKAPHSHTDLHLPGTMQAFVSSLLFPPATRIKGCNGSIPLPWQFLTRKQSWGITGMAQIKAVFTIAQCPGRPKSRAAEEWHFSHTCSSSAALWT